MVHKVTTLISHTSTIFLFLCWHCLHLLKYSHIIFSLLTFDDCLSYFFIYGVTLLQSFTYIYVQLRVSFLFCKSFRKKRFKFDYTDHSIHIILYWNILIQVLLLQVRNLISTHHIAEYVSISLSSLNGICNRRLDRFFVFISGFIVVYIWDDFRNLIKS